MKRRLFSLLLAVCFAAALLPVVATAEPKTATLALRSNDKNIYPHVEEGGAPYYAVTTAAGVATEKDATEKNYNIKFTYPTGGKPTLYLKNANIVSGVGHALAKSDTVQIFSLDIVVESDSVINGKHNGIAFNNGDLTVKGPGTLKIVAGGAGISLASVASAGSLIVEDVKLDITAAAGFAAVSVAGGDVVVNGGEVRLFSQNGNAVEVSRFYYTGADDTRVEYKLPGYENRGNVGIHGGVVSANGNLSGNGLCVEGNIAISGGAVDIAGGNRAVQSEGSLSITGGEVTLSGRHVTREAIALGDGGIFSITGGVVTVTGVRAAFAKNAVPSMIGHAGYTALAGDAEDTADTFDKTVGTKYKYFRLTDGTTVETEDADSTEETTETTLPAETTEDTETTTVPDTPFPGKGGRTAVVLLIAGTAVLVALGIAGAVLFIRKKKKIEN